MKKLILSIMVLISLFGIFGCTSDPAGWSDEKLNDWFKKGEWLNGWNVKPDESINKRELAVSYFKNPAKWDKAFQFLKSNDLSKLEIKRFDIVEGDVVYAPVSEYLTKNEEDAKFEAHKKYIDIQYVISGVEQMSVSPLSKIQEVKTPYDATKDVEFMTVSETSTYTANPEKFFIFFPSDIHRPGLKLNENSQVRKIVVKVKVE
jgi:YhcH/YjgK/YiaL family protein